MTLPWGSTLTLKKRGEDRLVLSPPLSLRFLFAVLFLLALAILVSALVSAGEPGLRLRTVRASIILAAVMGIGLLYNDSWTFDRRRRTAESRFGLFLLCRRRGMPLESVRSIRLEAARSMIRLVAVDAGGSTFVLDSARRARKDALKETGRRIAGFCGIPFTS